MSDKSRTDQVGDLEGVPVTITLTGRAYTSATDYMRQPAVREQMRELEQSPLWKSIVARRKARGGES